jgi:two-component system sensor kinase FixL
MRRSNNSLYEQGSNRPISASENGSAINGRPDNSVDCRVDPAARARLVAMSAMTSAMAHELSQPLSAATNYIETGSQALRDCFASIQQLAATVENAGRQTARAIELVRRMRSFVMTGTVKKQPEELARMIANVWSSLGQPRDVALVSEIAPEAATLMVERIHFEAVIANLLLNALQATQGELTRRIWVTASVEDSNIVLRVEDSGPGIPDEVRACLFEPLFTTRPDGTGLGLPICQTLVDAHDGTIWAEPSEPGRGAVFVVAVPVEATR